MRVPPVLLVLAAILSACTTTHGVRPVGKGAVALEGSFGGPLTEVYGAPIPLPFSAVGATYGVSDRTDVHAAWHPSAAAFYGLAAFDAGASYLLLHPNGAAPRLMGDAMVTIAAGDNEPGDPAGGFRLWLQPSLTASWDWGKNDRQTFYVTGSAFTQPAPELHVLPSLSLGHWWGIGPRLHVVTEVRWVAPFQSTVDLVPHYYAPGNLGAISTQLGLRYRFGGER